MDQSSQQQSLLSSSQKLSIILQDNAGNDHSIATGAACLSSIIQNYLDDTGMHMGECKLPIKADADTVSKAVVFLEGAYENQYDELQKFLTNMNMRTISQLATVINFLDPMDIETFVDGNQKKKSQLLSLIKKQLFRIAAFIDNKTDEILCQELDSDLQKQAAWKRIKQTKLDAQMYSRYMQKCQDNNSCIINCREHRPHRFVGNKIIWFDCTAKVMCIKEINGQETYVPFPALDSELDIGTWFSESFHASPDGCSWMFAGIRRDFKWNETFTCYFLYDGKVIISVGVDKGIIPKKFVFLTNSSLCFYNKDIDNKGLGVFNLNNTSDGYCPIESWDRLGVIDFPYKINSNGKGTCIVLYSDYEMFLGQKEGDTFNFQSLDFTSNQLDMLHEVCFKKDNVLLIHMRTPSNGPLNGSYHHWQHYMYQYNYITKKIKTFLNAESLDYGHEIRMVSPHFVVTSNNDKIHCFMLTSKDTKNSFFSESLLLPSYINSQAWPSYLESISNVYCDEATKLYRYKVVNLVDEKVEEVAEIFAQKQLTLPTMLLLEKLVFGDMDTYFLDAAEYTLYEQLPDVVKIVLSVTVRIAQ